MSTTTCPNCNATLSLTVAGTAPSPTPTPTPSPAPSPTPGPSKVTTYPAAKLVADDKRFLYKMISPYKQALKAVPGSHQVHFDMLTDGFGRLYSDAVPQPPGTVKDEHLRSVINQSINDALYVLDANHFDATTYAGPLAQIYANLVAAKLGK